MSKPSIFFGSSLEGLEFARGARSLLSTDGETTLWNEGFFRPGDTFIDTLLNQSARFDFAVLVLTPDDLVASRQEESLGPRDNILFELGLFMGQLGRNRTFMLHSRSAQLKIPSDLRGVAAAEYDWPRNDNDVLAAMGPACDQIRSVIRDLGIVGTRLSAAVEHQSQALQQQERTLAKLSETQLLFSAILTMWEAQHMRHIRDGGIVLYEAQPGTKNELRSLIGRGLIAKKTRGYINELPYEFNLVEHFDLTKLGEQLIYLRDKYELEAGQIEEPND